MQAPIRRIITQSTVDGPGNRVAVFLQGCNFRCAYCHNPETWHRPTLGEQGEWRWMSVDEVMSDIRRAVPFVRGITVSGGECMLYPGFVESLFLACRQIGLHCLIDSNGTIPFSQFPTLMQVTDGVMLDVKAWSPEVFRHLTNGEISRVKENLQFLLRSHKLEEVRIVCLPGEVDIEDTLRGIAHVTGTDVRLRLIPFRPQGVVGRLANCPSPTEEEMQRYQALWEKLVSTIHPPKG